MEKYSTVSCIRNGVLYLLVLLYFSVSGCAGVGSTVSSERMIPLIEAEKNQGDFSYGSLTLEYSFSLTGGSLVSGGSNMILAGKATYQGRFDSLDIRILFLDSAGTVLQQKFIYSSGYRTGDDRISNSIFQKTFAVPAGSSAITFTYYVQEHNGRD